MIRKILAAHVPSRAVSDAVVTDFGCVENCFSVSGFSGRARVVTARPRVVPIFKGGTSDSPVAVGNLPIAILGSISQPAAGLVARQNGRAAIEQSDVDPPSSWPSPPGEGIIVTVFDWGGSVGPIPSWD